MHKRRQQEGDKGGFELAEAQGRDGRVVDVAEQEVVDGAVPVARVLVPRDAVPPVAVEAAVGEEGEFGEDVEQTLPDDVPGQQLLEQEREEHVDDGPGQLAGAAVEGQAGVAHAHRAAHGRVDVCLADDHHHPDDAKRRGRLFGNVPPVAPLLPRVLELVHHRRQERPVGEVGGGEVARVVVRRAGALAAQVFVQLLDLGGDDRLECVELVRVERLFGLDRARDARDLGLFRGKVGAGFDGG